MINKIITRSDGDDLFEEEDHHHHQQQPQQQQQHDYYNVTLVNDVETNDQHHHHRHHQQQHQQQQKARPTPSTFFTAMSSYGRLSSASGTTVSAGSREGRGGGGENDSSINTITVLFSPATATSSTFNHPHHHPHAESYHTNDSTTRSVAAATATAAAAADERFPHDQHPSQAAAATTNTRHHTPTTTTTTTTTTITPSPYHNDTTTQNSHKSSHAHHKNYNSSNNSQHVRIVHRLYEWSGSSVVDKLNHLLAETPVLLVGRQYCPLAHEALDLLTEQLCVTTWVLWIDDCGSLRSKEKQDILQRMQTFLPAHQQPQPQGRLRLYCSLFSQPASACLPAIFLRGQYLGNAEDLYALYQSGKLERRLLRGAGVGATTVGGGSSSSSSSSSSLMERCRTRDTDRLETARLEPVYRAATPPKSTKIWFPDVVNAHVARVASLFVLLVGTVSASFYDRSFVRYIVTSMFVNFSLRAIGGYALSPYGILSTVLTAKLPPQFAAGAAWQLGTFCGVGLSLMALVFNLLAFPGHEVAVASIMAVIAAGAALPGICNRPWGPILIEYGIRLRLIEDNVYRLYLHARYETMETWRYRYVGPKPAKPVKIYTNRHNPIALRYKKKSEEWRKDDFDPIRHIQPEYFALPMSIGGLAVAYKFATQLDNKASPSAVDQRDYLISDQWFQVFASVAAFFYVFMMFLYLTKTLLWPNKAKKEWDDPHRSAFFSCITMCFMFFGFLCYDTVNAGARTAGQLIGRSLFWMGSLAHVVLTIAKAGEWIGRRMDLEHVDTSWMLIPMGLGVASFVGGLVHPFSILTANAVANVMVIRFLLSFAMLLWITLFVITFLKVVTHHNYDNNVRHGVWHWLSVTCIVGVADFTLCQNYEDPLQIQMCGVDFGLNFWMGVFLLFSLLWSLFSRTSVVDRTNFSMGYWFVCFALDALAMSASLFYYANPLPACRIIEMVALSIATTANMVAFLHTALALIRRRDVCTPVIRLGPLSFMRLTHSAMRQSLATVRFHLESINLNDNSKDGAEELGLFAAHFNRFRIVYEEHTRQKDEVLFKAFSDFFPRHPRRYRDEHNRDLVRMKDWCELASKVINSKESMTARQGALSTLQAELPQFFTYYRQHTRGEDENLLPIVNKYFSTQLCVQLGRDIWRMTPAEKWETMVPFCMVNLPRQAQRVAYLRSLCWALPERAQQLGAIVYRNVDDVMWERLRVEIPEMIPRGARNWQRYQ